MNMNQHIALQAAEWYFRLQDPDASSADHAACADWRNTDPLHEAAWQRAQQVSMTFGALPGKLAHSTLQRSHAASRRRAIKSLTMLMVAGSAGWQAWHSEPVRLQLAQYSTRTGERKQIQLADGTVVHLNTSTGINTRIGASQRQITLEAGEILVQTGHQPADAPLVIVTRYGRLQPLGTRFIVRQTANDVQLLVLQGNVAVTTEQGKRRTVPAGSQTRFDDHNIMPLSALPPHADGWTQGVLYARELRLADLAEELARYRHGIVRCDPAVADLRLSGTYQLADTDQVFASLPLVLPVDVRYLTRYWVSFHARSVK